MPLACFRNTNWCQCNPLNSNTGTLCNIVILSHWFVQPYLSYTRQIIYWTFLFLYTWIWSRFIKAQCGKFPVRKPLFHLVLSLEILMEYHCILQNTWLYSYLHRVFMGIHVSKSFSEFTLESRYVFILWMEECTHLSSIYLRAKESFPNWPKWRVKHVFN